MSDKQFKKIFICIDDSGNLHKNSKDDFFIYAGILFDDLEEKARVLSKYHKTETEIRMNNKNYSSLELKAYNLCKKHKNSLYRIIKRQNTFIVEVKISDIYDKIMDNKKSRNRYKDYMINRIVRMCIEKMIYEGKITTETPIVLDIHIDGQGIATDGYYTLEETIREELFVGKYRQDGTLREPVFSTEGKINVSYKDSNYNVHIRAADILANRKLHYKRTGRHNKMSENHTHLKLP